MEKMLQEFATTGPRLNKMLLPTMDVNCSKLFAGDKGEVDRVNRMMPTLRRTLLPNEEVSRTVVA